MFPTLLYFFYLLCIVAVHMLRFIYYGWFLPYLELVLLIAPLVVLFLSLPSMISAKTAARCPSYTEKGKEEEFLLSFESQVPLILGHVWLRYVTVNEFTGELEQREAEYHNLTKETLAFPLPTGSCGRMTFQITRLRYSDLLGFFSLHKQLPAVVSCTILPHSSAPQHNFHLDEVLNAIPVLKPKVGGGLAEDYDLREYRPGDPANSIHWKLSSKTDKLIFREPLIPENRDIFLVLSSGGDTETSLALIRWLSSELCSRELPHYIVSGRQYAVSNEQESFLALVDILSAPLQPPCAFDASKARCIFTVSSGEVRIS